MCSVEHMEQGLSRDSYETFYARHFDYAHDRTFVADTPQRKCLKSGAPAEPVALIHNRNHEKGILATENTKKINVLHLLCVLVPLWLTAFFGIILIVIEMRGKRLIKQLNLDSAVARGCRVQLL